LLEYWEAFAAWVLSLPQCDYPKLQGLATSGRATGINELGLELANALDGSRDLAADARAAAEALGESILERKIRWAVPHVKTPAFWPPADPAVLVLSSGMP
jgi:hypothetical protein